MARIDTLGNFLTDVAAAIRAKKGTTDTILASNFDTEITSIEGGSKYAPRYISFYAYTGTELNEEIANLDTSNITSMGSMFYNCAKLTDLDLSSFITSEVTNMNHMFTYCRKLTSLKLNNFNTSKVTDMSYMFSTCNELTSLNLSNFDTSKVINMSTMFYSCKKLTSLNLSNFDTSKVIDMSSMFNTCEKLVNIPKLNAINVVDVNAFASKCTSLTDFGGLENLGQAYSTTQSPNFYQHRLDLSNSTLLTEQSLINVLNNLFDIATKGCKTQQVILGSTNLAKLTSEEGQQALSSATEKGWTVS